MPRVDFVQAKPDEMTGVPEALASLGMTLDQLKALGRQILVAIPYRAREGVNAGICIHYGLWGPLGVKVFHAVDPHGGFIEVVRAGIVRSFLDTCKRYPELRYLIMIDNDEAVDPDCIFRLARHDEPVVSGIVCSASETKGIFACITVKVPSGAAYFPTIQHTGVMPASGLVEVHQAGTGLICIRRDILEDLTAMNERPFYIPEHIRLGAYDTGDLHKSEDISFADVCEKYGYKRYADLSCHATHFKFLSLGWPKDKRDPNMTVDDWVNWVIKPHDPEGG